MPSYKTPGVYVQEISKLPASIAPVATAIPAFIGYTEKHTLKNGEDVPNTPIRLQSMLEYEEIFGGAFNEKFTVTLTDNPGELLPAIAVAPSSELSPYLLFYQLQMYFANGGGPCYVVSVGKYDLNDPSAIDIKRDDLLKGVAVCEMEDEITLLAVPEAMVLGDGERRDVFNDMLSQCSRLQDRFAIIDVRSDPADTVFNDGLNFRNNQIGPDNLKYGAAYYPALRAAISYAYLESDMAVAALNASNPGIFMFDGMSLKNIETGKNSGGDELSAKAKATIKLTDYTVLEGDTLTVNGTDIVITADVSSAADAVDAADKLTILINTELNPTFTAVQGINPDDDTIIIENGQPGTQSNTATIAYQPGVSNTDVGITITQVFYGGANGPNKALYNAIKKELDKHKPTLYPCGAIAGVYARVDRDRGVWKAPANVSLNGFSAPSVLVTHEEQENLNVDATSGKSINAIRFFNGKGILVWGARTLAGNDNEWRYVPVRRLYIFVEESIKKATEFVVFEPNDAKTWVRVKAMIGNFLTGLWREGALAGAAPQDAFFVKVGLGETMTTDDILNGIMNIEIGMAAVRPAEFIILKFSHKLQES